MNFFIFFTLGVFVYFDLSVLRQKSADLFARVFHVPGWVWPAYSLLIPVLIWKTGDWDYLLSLPILFLFPVYLIKRYRFNQFLQSGPDENSDTREDLDLAINAFGVIVVWFLGMLIAVLLIKVVAYMFPRLDSELGQLIVLAAASYALVISLVRRSIRKCSDLSLKKIFALVRNQKSIFIISVFPAAVGAGLAYVSSQIILSRETQPMTPLREVIDTTTSSGVLMAFVGVAILLAPFFEEIIFRGYFYHVIQRYKGQRFAIIFIALAFAVMHFEQYWGDWLAIGMITLLGFVLTFFRAKTGSSIPGIILHYVYNFCMTVFPILFLVLSNPSYYEYQIKYQQLNSAQKEELLLASIQEDPKYHQAYNDLAWLYSQEERSLNKALDLVEQALTYDPERFAYLDTKAEVLYKMGRIEEAVTIARDLADKYPSNQYVLDQLEKFKSALNE